MTACLILLHGNRAQIEAEYAANILYQTKRYSRLSFGYSRKIAILRSALWNGLLHQSIHFAEYHNDYHEVISNHLKNDDALVTEISTVTKSTLPEMFRVENQPIKSSSSYSESKILNKNEKKKFFSSFSIRRRTTSAHTRKPEKTEISSNSAKRSNSLQKVLSLSRSVTYQPIADTEDYLTLSSPYAKRETKSIVNNNADQSQNDIALTRIVSILKENGLTTNHGDVEIRHETSRKFRNCREARSTQSYSPIEQKQTELPEISMYVQETIHFTSQNENGFDLNPKATVIGEIYLNYKGPFESASPICFQLYYATLMDSREIIDDYISCVEHDIYKVNINRFKSMREKLASERVLCFRYHKSIEFSNLPISVKPMWKCEYGKSQLLIKYHIHPAILFPLDNVQFTTNALHNNIQSVQSIPQGELYLKQRQMKWHIGQIYQPKLKEEGVVRAQFIHTASNHKPQPISVRFNLYGQLLTPLEIEQGTDARFLWATITRVQKTVKSGTYIAGI
ncbi:hypothetical protein K501DRAFT_268390 [Backusella circina FSU 941]|nr:hypothetical protein K501DRAFT_268390 [Backusella circina FSU 941]